MRADLGELFRIPDGYEVVLGNGGSTAFWDAAAFGLVEKRAENLSFGEFGSKFAKANAAPWLEAPHVITAEGGALAEVEVLEGVDVYAWPHNETSTGVMAPSPGSTATPAHSPWSTRRARPAASTSTRRRPTSTTSRRRRTSPATAVSGSPSSPRGDRARRAHRGERPVHPRVPQPEERRRQLAAEPDAEHPALTTLLLLEDQTRWMLDNGGLAWVDARTRESSSALYDWATASDYATPFVVDPSQRSQVVATIDFAESIDAAAVAKVLRQNGIVDTEPYRKLGRNQLRVATFAAIEPDDVRQLIRSIDHVVGALAV